VIGREGLFNSPAQEVATSSVLGGGLVLAQTSDDLGPLGR